MLAIPRPNVYPKDLEQLTLTSPLLYQSPASATTPNVMRSAMLCMMPSSRPLAPRRPKLSLWISTVAMAPTKPTITLDADRATDQDPFTKVSIDPPLSPIQHTNTAFSWPTERGPLPPECSMSPVPAASSLGQGSPSIRAVPYTLGQGSRSILRNSPLPSGQISSTSLRPPSRTFQRVRFREKLVEEIPAGNDENVLEPRDSDDECASKSGLAEQKPLCEPNNMAVHGRRKRRREWIWRPVGDDILGSFMDASEAEARRERDLGPIRHGVDNEECLTRTKPNLPSS